MSVPSSHRGRPRLHGHEASVGAARQRLVGVVLRAQLRRHLGHQRHLAAAQQLQHVGPQRVAVLVQEPVHVVPHLAGVVLDLELKVLVILELCEDKGFSGLVYAQIFLRSQNLRVTQFVPSTPKICYCAATRANFRALKTISRTIKSESLST